MYLHPKLHALLHKIKHDVLQYQWFLTLNALNRLFSPRIHVKSIEETIAAIADNRLSVSRFGDGEYLWMTGGKQNSFQDESEAMAARLREVLKSSLPGHIICLSDAFDSLSEYNHFAKRFWSEFMYRNRLKWIELLEPGKTYYSTNISRMYMDYKDKELSRKRFSLIRRIWSGRDIVIVEGEKTRLGVGNDLFADTNSIRRILAPATNAFQRYEEILKQVQSIEKDALLLAALGPTATIICYDLAKLGYQAVDIGHIDVEYEWMLMGAKEKVPIANKYVNEAKIQGQNVADLADEQYQAQIVYRIE